MTPDLDQWLRQATRGLSKDSSAQVGTEIREHYEAAREAAMMAGAPSAEAERAALSALGDAGIANIEYQRVLLTSSEAKLLRQGNQEAWLVCSSSWVRTLLTGVSVIMLLAAGAFFTSGWIFPARITLAIGLGTGFMIVAPLLPVYTPSRARVFRCVRWVVQMSLLLMAFGPGALRMSWLLILCVWQFGWVEWKRASIRRKLPVSQWPRQLYL